MKLALVVVAPLILGPAGYAVGIYMNPDPPQAVPSERIMAPKEHLFKLPLGKFTVQVMQPRRIIHIRFDMDVYIAGAGAFENINGAGGRAQLRDATIAIVSDLAESTLWVDEGEEKNIDKADLAKQIVLSIYKAYPMVRSAKINRLDTTLTARL